MGNAGNDKLYGDAGADSLNGGKGNDTLTGGDGADVFFYASGEGNDVIADFTAGQNTIKLTSGTVAAVSLKNSDMVFKIGSGTLTVKNGKNQEIAIGNSIYYNNLVYDKNKTAIMVGAEFSGSLKSSDYATTVKTINASKVTKSTNIIGNAQDNIIIGSSKAETILGGAGNDTLTGGKGKDIFVYESGNDVITDYTAGQDKIKIASGTISKTTYSGKNVIFTIGSGSLIVKDSKGKKITITDSKNKTTTQSYTQDVSYKAASNTRWFTADDNNFITDEIQINDIAKMQESNYSAIQANVVENKNELAITDAIFSATSLDKK